MLGNELISLQKLANSLNYVIHISEINGEHERKRILSFCTNDIHGVIRLIIEENSKNLIILRHRTPELTAKFGGRVVSRKWLARFMQPRELSGDELMDLFDHSIPKTMNFSLPNYIKPMGFVADIVEKKTAAPNCYAVRHTELENVGIDDRGVEDMPDYVPEEDDDDFEYEGGAGPATYSALGGWGYRSYGDNSDYDCDSGEMAQRDWGDGGDDFDGASWEEYMG